MAGIKKILDELKADASFDSTGRFTLDRKKAKEKMQKYQLIDPHYYVLELISAAVAGGATFVDVYQDADDCIITFDGENYSKEDLENIYSSLFVSQKDTSLERFRELAIGLNSAMALKPSFIKVQSGKDGKTVQMLLRPGQEDALQPSDEQFVGTKIHVKEPVSWNVASKFFTRYIAQQLPTEGKVIKDRCRYAPIPVSVNSQIINTDESTSLENVLCRVKFKKDNAGGILGISRIPRDFSQLHFVKWGVLITSRQLRISFIPLCGIIHADGLLKNASQSDLVDNDLYKKCIEEVREAQDDAIIKLAERYSEAGSEYDYHRRMQTRTYLLDIIETRFRAQALDEKSSPLMKKLAEISIIETTDKSFTSLAHLSAQLKKTGYLPFSRKYFNMPHPEGLTVVYADDEKQVNFYSKIFLSRIKNVEQDFFRVFVREQKKREWESRKGENPVLLNGPLSVKTISDQGLHVQVGLCPREPDAYCRIDLYKEGGYLVKKHIDAGGLYFDSALNCDGLEPSYTYDDVVFNDTLKEALIKVFQSIPALYLDMAQRYSKEEWKDSRETEIVRSHLLSYLDYVLKGSAPAQAFEKRNVPPEELSKKRELRIYDGPGVVRKGSRVETFALPEDTPVVTEIWENAMVFRTVSGVMASLAMLKADMEKNMAVSYVKKEMPGPAPNDRLVVVVDERNLRILSGFFGWYKLVDYEKGLLEERAAVRHSDRPKVESVVDLPVVAKASLMYKGITGQAGLLETPVTDLFSRRGTRYGKDGPEGLVKVLKKQRLITNRALLLPFSNIYAVANHDQITANGTWTDIAEDASWNDVKDAILHASLFLAEECIGRLPELSGSSRERVLQFLTEFCAYYVERLEYNKTPLQSDPLFLKLMDAPLFLLIDDRYASLNEIQKDKEAFGNVAYVSRGFKVEGNSERIIIRADGSQAEILGRIFGYKFVINVETQLKDKMIKNAVRQSKVPEEPVINQADVLFVHEIKSGEITGQMGLVRKTGSSCGFGCQLKLYCEKIPVVGKLINPGVQMLAAVNSDSLSVNRQWNGVAEDDNYKKVLSVLEENQKVIMEKLVKTFDNLPPEEKRTAGIHILSYITSICSGITEIKKARENDLLNRLICMPLISALGGKTVSLGQLVDDYRKNGKLYYVPLWTDRVPMQEDRLTVVLDNQLMQIMKRVFLYYTDYTSTLDSEEIARKNMEKQPLANLSIEKECLIKQTVDKGGIKGELGLPVNPGEGGGILFCRRNIPVIEKPLYKGSMLLGVVNKDDFSANDTHTDIILYATEKRTLLDGVYRLYSQLAESYNRQGSLKEKAALHLLNFLYDQKHSCPGEYKVMDGELEIRISSLPLLPAAGERMVSVEVAVETIARLGFIPFIEATAETLPPSDEVILLFEKGSYALSFCRRFFGPDRLKNFSMVLSERAKKAQLNRLEKEKENAGRERRELLEKIELEKKTKEKKSPRDSKRKRGKTKETPDESPAGPENMLPGNLPEEDRLVLALKRELRIIRERGDYKLSEKTLKNMMVSYMEGRPAIVFNRDNQYIIINPLNPAIREIAGSIDKSPQLIYYVISMIYSAINREMKEITDADEMDFQMVMLDKLLEHPALK